MSSTPTPPSIKVFTAILSTAFLAAMILAPAADAQTSVPGFSKAFNPSTIGPGSVSTLRFDITNTTSFGVRGLAFTDNLPAGVQVASPANATTTCLGTVSAPSGGTSIVFNDGGIGASSSCAVTVDVTSSTPGTHTNVSGDLTSDAGNSGNATADLTVVTDRPGFTKSFSPSSVFFGGRSTLTFTIDNTANAAGAANLTFSDTLPFGMVIASPANSSNSCGGGVLTAPAGGSVISYGIAFNGDATVGAGASCTLSVDVVGNAIGVLGNTSGELTSIPAPFSVSRSSGKAGAELTVTVEQISLTKTFRDDPVPPGGTVTLEFTVRNLDRRAPATNLAFTDDLDAVLSGLAAVGLPLADPCGSGSSLAGTSVISLTGGNLPAEGSCTFSVLLQVPVTAPAGSFANTTSSITADIDGGGVTGDPASDDLFVEPAPRLTKEFTDDPAGAGDTVTLEFTITNTSPDFAATDIAFSDVFDEILQTASSVPADGFCGTGSTAVFTPLIDPGGGSSSIPAQVVVSGASLAAGDSCTFSLVLDVFVGAAAGTFPNTTSSITAVIGGEQPVTGGAASDDLVVVGAPRLTKEFIDDPVAPGGTVTLRFTLEYGEGAPGDATDITFSDDLEAALSGLVATALPADGFCGAGSSLTGTMTLLMTGGSMAPGEVCTFDVTLQVPATATAGTHTNTTSVVVATVLGVSGTDNPASDDLRIAGLSLTKEFTDDPVLPGGTVNLRFTIVNETQTETATEIFFRDDLDTALDGMTATGLPLNDVCGTASSLIGVGGNSVLVFQDGTLGPGASCTFDVTLQVPAKTLADTYINTTSAFSAMIGGGLVVFDNASDELVVNDNFLALTKEFTDDPVSPGGAVNLRFIVTNLNLSETVTDIAFSDDLDATLTGLVSSSGTVAEVCGLGSQVTGTSFLSVTGGSLAAGASCIFDVSLAVPATAPQGTTVVNTTSMVGGMINGSAVKGGPASDLLQINSLTFEKAFGGDVEPGDTVTLTFTIQNLSVTDGVSDVSFSDDLDAVLSGLAAVGLPANDVCGTGSELAGTSFLTLLDGSLLPGGSCSFAATLQVPATAEPGSYLNETSGLRVGGIPVLPGATDTLVVLEVMDSDGDGVLDSEDFCEDTIIPESVPTRSLGVNRYALVDDDTVFDTTPPPGGGNGPGDVFTTTDTGGCSCEQIIELLGLGKGHSKFGCSLGAMRDWVDLVSTASSGIKQLTAPASDQLPVLGLRTRN